MKILIVNSSDINGGAARAAYRLHRSLLEQGVDSQMLVQSKQSDDYTVKTSGKTKIQKGINILRPSLDSIPVAFYKDRSKTLFSPSCLGFSNIVNKINDINPDIVHLHWICGGMMRIEDISHIKAPIVWSLHDMWPFTGGCHYDEDCFGYEKNCGNCKVLRSKKENDLSKSVFKRKSRTYNKINSLTIVGSSKWISSCAKNSTLFKDNDTFTLPNCIDTKLFRPIDKSIVKTIFNIPKDKKIILFGAMHSLGDPRKGSKELFDAINMLDLKETVFVIAGSSQTKEMLELKYPVYFISPLRDEVSLPLMYNVADVMIVPSLQENLANSIVESLACGIPVVAFDIGGNKDMIDHMENGYLAKAKNSEDMSNGIKWVIENKNYLKLSENARKKVINIFDSKVVAKKYIGLYEKIANQL